MNPDDQLDNLFRAARQETYEPRTLGFETRLLARIREQKEQRNTTGWLAWRVAPFFAVLTIAIGVWATMTPEPNPLAEMETLDIDSQSYVYLTASR